jgi:hypothetical protein
MALFGFFIVFCLTWGYDFLNYKTIINKELQNINNISDEISLHLDSHLKELASAPLVKNSLLNSNSEFAALSDDKRQ